MLLLKIRRMTSITKGVGPGGTKEPSLVVVCSKGLVRRPLLTPAVKEAPSGRPSPGATRSEEDRVSLKEDKRIYLSQPLFPTFTLHLSLP